MIKINFINLMGNYLKVPEGTKTDKKLLKFFRKRILYFNFSYSQPYSCI